MGGRLNLDGGTLNLDGGRVPPRPPYNLSTAADHNELLCAPVKIIKNNLPCFSTSDWKPNFKSLFVHLGLINFRKSYDLCRKDYLSLSNWCLS